MASLRGETGLGVRYFLKQCWILISDLPGEFVFNQKEELPLICKLYWMIFLKKINQRIRLLIFHFLYFNFFINESLINECGV